MAKDEEKRDALPEEDASLAGEQEQAALATAVGEGEQGEEEKERLNLEVEVESPSACERHVTVTIPRADIDRYFESAVNKMMPEASVPGFRPGRAPRKLVAQRFRKEVSDQIRGELLMDSIGQVTSEQEFTAISEPDFDLEAVELPNEGPMTFEFDLEVRPEFDLPDWKGLEIRQPVKEFTEEDVDKRIESILSRYGKLVPHEGPVSAGDYLTADITSSHEGRQLAQQREAVVRVQPTLSFHDARLTGFDKLMEGAQAGETRNAKVTLTADAENVDLRGEEVDVAIKVLDVKKLDLPALDEDFLESLGGFESVDELRDAIRQHLQRQLAYEQQREARQQASSALTESADWDLPPGLLKRQSKRELERAVLELRRSGFEEEEIRARENQLRQNSAASTAQALKEHFILERIAEEEGADVEPVDYDVEIALIARQSGEPPRRVRAQLEKQGLMDSLRNQIIERKVIDRVLQEATFKEVPHEPSTEEDVEAIDMAIGGAESEPPTIEAPEEA